MMDEKKAEEAGQVVGKSKRFVPPQPDFYSIETRDQVNPDCMNCGKYDDEIAPQWDKKFQMENYKNLPDHFYFDTWDGYQALCILSGFAPHSSLTDNWSEDTLIALSKPDYATPCTSSTDSGAG